ncbi:cytochrome b5-like heme/steroid binding domain-containing protein, partial [Paraphysoderma sedebokerense]
LTPEELALYNGTDPTKPIYLAVIGDVFDVTAGKDYYGPEGGYKFFAGRDAGRAFATGCFESHLTNDLRGLTDDQIKSIEDWRSFYHDHDKYLYVGKVVHPPVDPNSPIPEDCNIEGGKKE